MIYCIIPARGGSKRLKRKNIQPVLNKPMIMWAIEAAIDSKHIDKSNIFISTEDEEISEICKDYNVIQRPEYLARDDIWTQDVVNHFIEQKNIKDEDLIVILQANSPEIECHVIDRCIDKLMNENLWQVHTVDQNYVNNGAIHVYYVKVREHKGKVNYNGVVVTDWIDVHYEEDIKDIEKKILEKNKKG